MAVRNASVLHDVHHFGGQGTGLPGKGGARLQDDAQVGIARLQSAEQADEMLYVIVLAGHQVAAAQVKPLELGEPRRELLLDMCQAAFQFVGRGFAMAMAVETFDALGQLCRQLFGHHAETSAGGTGVIEFCLYFGVFGVDADAARNVFLGLLDLRPEPLVLAQRVEGDVAAATQDFREISFRVGRGVGVGLASELFEGQSGLVGRAGRSGMDVFAEDGECAPQGEGLEGQDDFHAGAVGHAADEAQVPAEQVFLHDVAGGGKLIIVYHRSICLIHF